MGYFKEEKTEVELYIEEHFKYEEDFTYNFEIEIEEEGEMVEIKPLSEERQDDGNNIPSSEQLPPKSGNRISSRAELLFDILKQGRLGHAERKLRTIWERLRQDKRTK